MSLVFGLSPFSVVATIVVIALVWWVIARSRRRTTPERKSRLNDEVVLSRFRVLLGGVEARLEISRDSLWWSAPNDTNAWYGVRREDISGVRVNDDTGETTIFAYPKETHFNACHIRCHMVGGSVGGSKAREAKRLKALLLYWIQERGNIGNVLHDEHEQPAASGLGAGGAGGASGAKADLSDAASMMNGGSSSSSAASNSDLDSGPSSSSSSSSSSASTSTPLAPIVLSDYAELESRLRRRKLLVIVNPVAGSRGGWHTWNKVAPIFEQASVLLEFEVKETKYRGHARDIIRQHPLESCNGIVCVGGDGTLFEVLNSLVQVYQMQDPEMLIEAERELWPLPHTGRIPIPLAIIPAGSGNGLACTINCRSVVDAALRIIHNRTSALDIMRAELLPKSDVGGLSSMHFDPSLRESTESDSSSNSDSSSLLHHDQHQHQHHHDGISGSIGNPTSPNDATTENRVVYAFLQVSYGVMCDVDFDSEYLRALGDLRFAIYGVVNVVRKPLYYCRLYFEPWLVRQVIPISAPAPPSDGPRHTVDPGWVCTATERAVLAPPREQERVQSLDSADGYGWVGMLNTRTFADGWLSSPFVELNDGTFDIVLVPARCPRKRIVVLLFEMMRGYHPLHRDVGYFSVKRVEMELKPHQRPNRLDIDGECFMHDGRVIVQSLGRLCTVVV